MLTGHPRIRRASVLIEAVVGCIVLGVAIAVLMARIGGLRALGAAAEPEDIVAPEQTR